MQKRAPARGHATVRLAPAAMRSDTGWTLRSSISLASATKLRKSPRRYVAIIPVRYYTIRPSLLQRAKFCSHAYEWRALLSLSACVRGSSSFHRHCRHFQPKYAMMSHAFVAHFLKFCLSSATNEGRYLGGAEPFADSMRCSGEHMPAYKCATPPCSFRRETQFPRPRPGSAFLWLRAAQLNNAQASDRTARCNQATLSTNGR
jgi:hypothetical protein